MNMFENASVSHSAAHYLMTIAELHKERGYVRAVDVAERMSISRSAAHLGLKALKAKGLVVEDERHFYRLPDDSLDLAHHIMGNRSLLVRFFTEILGAPEEEAEQNACLIEHLLTEEAAQRLLGFVRILTKSPEGRRLVERFHEALRVDCPEEGRCELCEAYERCPLAEASGEAPMSEAVLRELMKRLEELTARLEGVVATSTAPPPPVSRDGDPTEAMAKANAYRRTLSDTVAVLEATRASFRSRQLKELRERIEAVLRE